MCLVLAAIFFIQLFFIAWDCQFISFHIYTQFFNSLLFYSGLFNVLMVSLFFSSFCLVNQRFSVLKMCSVTRTHSCCVLMSVLLTSSSNVDCMNVRIIVGLSCRIANQDSRLLIPNQFNLKTNTVWNCVNLILIVGFSPFFYWCEWNDTVKHAISALDLLLSWWKVQIIFCWFVLANQQLTWEHDSLFLAFWKKSLQSTFLWYVELKD